MLKQDKTLVDIAKSLNITKQKLNYYAKQLKDKGIIVKKGYGVWKVKKSSLGLRAKPTTNLHALQFYFPILKGKIKDNDWEIKHKLKHWTPKYTELEILGGLTVKNNNNKSISVYAKSRNINNLQEVDNLANKIKEYIIYYFKTKHEVILDRFNCKTSNLNLATEDREAKGMLRKGEKFELNLNKKSEKILPKDNINAKAWLDGSPFDFTAETNDKEWKREYLNMPFSIRDLRQGLFLMNEYNKNLSLHTNVQNEQLKTQIDTQKILKAIVRHMKSKPTDKKPSKQIGLCEWI